MSSAAGTFLVSSIVAIIFLAFGLYQGPKVSKAIIALRRPSQSGSLKDDPRNVEGYVDQALDVAYGFPAIVLTAVAYDDLSGRLTWINTVAVPGAVAIALAIAWFSSPRRIKLFLRLKIWRFSALSILIVAANGLGFWLSLTLPRPT